MSYQSVGQVFDPITFKAHLETVNIGWADSVTVHHTAYPDLLMRPKGWTIQHMRNLAHYYGSQLGWSAGPHLFTDEDQVFGLSPLTSPGTHARSFNRKSIGIEMLGNYDNEDPFSGRGAQVLETTAAIVAALLIKLGKLPDETTVKFHRDDPKTSKTCPGKKIQKSYFLGLVERHIQSIKRDNSQSDRIEDAEKPELTIEERVKRLESEVFT